MSESKRDHVGAIRDESNEGRPADGKRPYVAPAVEKLGSLAEITHQSAGSFAPKPTT